MRTAAGHATTQGRQLRLRFVYALGPRFWQGNRSVVEQQRSRAMNPMPQASPPPGFRLGHQVCPQGITFNVAAQRQKVVVLLNGEGLEAALVQGSGTSGV